MLQDTSKTTAPSGATNSKSAEQERRPALIKAANPNTADSDGKLLVEVSKGSVPAWRARAQGRVPALWYNPKQRAVTEEVDIERLALV